MDDEITGIYQVAKILDTLDEEARARVIRWAADKYDIDLTVPLADADVAAAAERTHAEAPPEKKDPEKPSFLDTQFRMHAGKKQLKKKKDED